MSDSWKFRDAPNTGCLTTVDILDNNAAITEVYHDYDGDWQFLNESKQSHSEDYARLVCLSQLVELDESINALHDLDYGWRAIRSSRDSNWVTEKNHPFPEYDEVGYYLENADWMAKYLENVNPPPLEARENLLLDHSCKLIFRFRHEMSDREDYDSERMWVVITDVDDHDFYTGLLQNAPAKNPGLVEGDEIRFHPTHIIEVDEAS